MGLLQSHGQFYEEDILFFREPLAREAVIHRLVAQIQRVHALDFELDTVVEEFMARERKGSTAIITGIAVPHIRSDQVDAFFMGVGIHHGGIDFHSNDAKPTHIVVLTMFPELERDLPLRFLAGLSRFLMKKETQKNLLKAETPQRIHQTFCSEI